MALVKCPECGRENVSDSAQVCPNCGFNVKEYMDEQKEKESEVLIQNRGTKKVGFMQKIGLLIIKLLPIFVIIIIVLGIIFLTSEEKHRQQEIKGVHHKLKDIIETEILINTYLEKGFVDRMDAIITLTDDLEHLKANINMVNFTYNEYDKKYVIV